MNNQKKILLLGGGGFIGTNIAFQLLKEGNSVSILDRSLPNAQVYQNLLNKPEIINIDLSDLAAVKKVLNTGNFDVVVHLIANIVPGSSFGEFLTDSDLNLKIGFKLLHEIYQAGIKNFIYFSSGGTVYGENGRDYNDENAPKNPISLYGWYKNAMEQYIQTYTYSHPINFAIIRPSNPYGHYQNIYGKQGFIAVSMGKILKKENLHIWGDGFVIRDYIFIEDLAKMTGALISKGFSKEIFNLGSGEGVSLNTIVELLRQVTNQTIHVEYDKARKVDVQSNILDVSYFDKYLNHEFISKTSLKEGMAKMWQWVNHSVTN